MRKQLPILVIAAGVVGVLVIALTRSSVPEPIGGPLRTEDGAASVPVVRNVHDASNASDAKAPPPPTTIIGGSGPPIRAKVGSDLRGPTLVAVGARWCKPCLRELPTLLDLAAQLRERYGVQLHYAFVDAKTDDPARLRSAFAELVALESEYVSGGDPLTAPAWIDVSGDPEWTWAQMVDGVPGLRERGIPLTLGFDRCGSLRLVTQEALTEEARTRILELAPQWTRCDG